MNSSRNSINRITEIKETEAQSKFVNERVSQIETYFGDLCAEFVSYTRRTAKMRNNGDELAKILLNYSVNEKINRTSALTLKRFAELLSKAEDYRHAEVDRLYNKVITPLSSYGDEVKRVRANIKTETAARKKELSQMKRMGKEQQSTRASEEQLHMATRDATKSADALEKHVIQFEARKLKGLKDILTDFVQIEMLWHAKALETFSEAFNVVQALKEEADLADFRNTLLRSGTFASLDGDNLYASRLSLDAGKSKSIPALNSANVYKERPKTSTSRSKPPTQPSHRRARDVVVEDISEQFSEKVESSKKNRNSQPILANTHQRAPASLRKSAQTYSDEEESGEDDDLDESEEDDDEEDEEEEEDDDDDDSDEESLDEDDDQEDESEDDEESELPIVESERHNQKHRQPHKPPPSKAPLKPALKYSTGKVLHTGR